MKNKIASYKNIQFAKMAKTRATQIMLLVLVMLPFCVRSAQQSFSNSPPIVINDSANPPTMANPYPSSITVTNPTIQLVTKVTVTLDGFTHSYPSDANILLVGPQGQTALVMSEVGGLATKYSVTNLTLTLDDDAASNLPLEAPLTTGTFKPTKRNPILGFDFPSPAPSGNSNAAASLSVFQNTDPNGTWRLFVVDDTSSDSGYITNGWSLNLTTTSVLLRIHLADSSHAVVSWPSALTNYTLQSTYNLSPTITWSNVLTVPVIVGGEYAVTNSISTTNTYYRLAK